MRNTTPQTLGLISVTNWMIVMKYSFLKCQWVFFLLRRLLLLLSESTMSNTSIKIWIKLFNEKIQNEKDKKKKIIISISFLLDYQYFTNYLVVINCMLFYESRSMCFYMLQGSEEKTSRLNCGCYAWRCSTLFSILGCTLYCDENLSIK